MLDLAFRRSLLVLIWIAVAACGDDDTPEDDRGDSDSGSDEMQDGGRGRAGSGGTVRLDGGFRDAGAGDDAGDADVGADEDAGGGQVSCVRDADCDDADACTEDECVRDVCTRAAIDPDDRNACTTDRCDPDSGVHNDLIAIDDSNGCTLDGCDPATGAVTHTPCASGLCDTTMVCLDTATTAVTDSPALVIPTGPADVSDTIQVTGAGTRLWDVNVRTMITHNFSPDLDITLRSPAGTVVTLTTDNGDDGAFPDPNGLPNVYDGTVWNDAANPAGVVPYTSNTGLVNDHPYVANMVATPLAPEEALGAFIGENPNGTWTLTISDDDMLDGGMLTAWGLDITTISAAPTVTAQTYTQSTATPVPDAGTTTSTLVVPAHASGARLCSLTVSTNITHPWGPDLAVSLRSPSGTIVTLTNGNGFDLATGGGSANVYAGTLWDDNANPAGQLPYETNDGLVTDHAYVDMTVATPLVPQEPLSAFLGDTVAGTWTLTVADVEADTLGTGALNSWSLNIGRCLR